ncbi:FAD-dependent pyridine nucleotide-disulfide oxidoreductase [Hyaloscypha variabilis F]|uniref:FAD-dependent pyridine nucleotide-disulfide oxidoreductase n=1 Tax=Hyaloscypha variabilis (strain UAMH 11265 / GT02V1 / F) TaxID=1149755 RepID=A0A2J6RWC9_HYAVF|nr:FAD-dependent pyridine nucleotide-disulfide oxidoreductase [Hyaloscypha variabilis F]
MALQRPYDALIIGSGQAGTPLASAFAKAGQKVVLIESTHIAGCCVNEGCTPTKTLITSGRVAHLTQRGPDYGIHTSKENETNQVLVDMKKVRQRKRDIVESFRGGSEKRLKDAGVEVLMGKAGFVSPTTVHVVTGGGQGSEKILTAKNIFINVGERPATPSLQGIKKLSKERVLDSTSIQELDAVPEKLVVIGGGYVGVEFAQLFGRLGSTVTVLQRAKQLLPREDQEVAQALKEILEDEGVVIKLESEAVGVDSVSENGSFTLSVKHAGAEQQIEGTHILFAAGRVPNTESLNLEAAGIETNARGYIVANEFLQTTAGHVYVLGDVKGPPAFTHISYDDFRIIKANLLPESPEAPKLGTTGRLVPYVVYTDPQLGHVGLHEHEARKQFPEKNIKTAKMPMAWVARALETDESKGLMKAVVDGDSGEILGFTCLGIEGGEVMAVVQMAIMGGVRYQKLQDAVWAHPSLAESLNNLWGFLE